jgi:phenylalanine-4-hydroxylase
MALRTGGLSGIEKLITSGALGTIELSTGLQVSGVFTNVIEQDGKPIYTNHRENSASFSRKELVSHGIANHAEGFVVIGN